MRGIDMKCEDHRGYKAVRKPTAGCPACWLQYFEEHASEAITLTGAEWLSFLAAIHKQISYVEQDLREEFGSDNTDVFIGD